jgi:hypothetical protein
MDDQPTCGKGLASNAALPAKLAEVIAALADTLAAHLAAVNQADPEHAVYERLVALHGQIAEQLSAAAADMTAARDLPMGPHDVAVMTSAAPRAAFAGFVRREEELLALLQARLEADRRMLQSMAR